VVRLSKSTTRISRRATSARNIDSFSPWWNSVEKSRSPMRPGELVVGREVGRGERGERGHVERRPARRLADGGDELAGAVTSRAQRA
jgi:hypothetical protein